MLSEGGRGLLLPDELERSPPPPPPAVIRPEVWVHRGPGGSGQRGSDRGGRGGRAARQPTAGSPAGRIAATDRLTVDAPADGGENGPPSAARASRPSSPAFNARAADPSR